MVIQVIAATIGSIGFAIFLKMRGKQIILSGVGAAITWIVYWICSQHIEGLFIPYFLAAIFVAIYAEIMARINKAPATIFLTAAAVPLIPGGRLYYTMAGLVNKDEILFSENGTAALTIALAISLAFVVVSVLNRYSKVIFFKKKQ